MMCPGRCTAGLNNVRQTAICCEGEDVNDEASYSRRTLHGAGAR